MADLVSDTSSSNVVVADPAPPSPTVKAEPTAAERAFDKALSKSTPSEAQKALKQVRKEKRAGGAETAALVQPEKPEAGSQKPDSDPPQSPDGVIDFTDLSKPTTSTEATAETPVVPTEEEPKGLDEAGKKKFADLNKDNAKVRKRAQEAEATRDALTAENETLKTQLMAAQQAPPALAGNAFGHVSNPAFLDWAEQDAQAQLRKLQKAGLDPNTDLTHAFYDAQGVKEERILTPDDLDTATDIVAQVGQRRTQIAAFAKSEATAAPIVNFAKQHVPEFKDSHAKMMKLDPATHGPELAALAALGALVRDGGYSLMKKSSAKAVTAKSVTGEPGDTARNVSSDRTAPREVATTMPPASRTSEGTVNIPSAVRDRAMKGDQNAVKEMIRLKTLAASRRVA